MIADRRVCSGRHRPSPTGPTHVHKVHTQDKRTTTKVRSAARLHRTTILYKCHVTRPGTDRPKGPYYT
eukprot:4586263-Prorocentrum_lima.AAC.1